MKVKVVLSRSTLDLMWGLSDRRRGWRTGELPVGPEEVVIELDDDIVNHVTTHCQGENLDDALRRYMHDQINDGGEDSP